MDSRKRDRSLLTPVGYAMALVGLARRLDEMYPWCVMQFLDAEGRVVGEARLRKSCGLMAGSSISEPVGTWGLTCDTLVAGRGDGDAVAVSVVYGETEVVTMFLEEPIPGFRSGEVTRLGDGDGFLIGFNVQRWWLAGPGAL